MRLNHHQNESLHLWPGLIDEIWMPDLFFVNAKNSHVHDGVTESKFGCLVTKLKMLQIGNFKSNQEAEFLFQCVFH